MEPKPQRWLRNRTWIPILAQKPRQLCLWVAIGDLIDKRQVPRISKHGYVDDLMRLAVRELVKMYELSRETPS